MLTEILTARRNPPKLRGNSVLLSFPRQPEFLFSYRNTNALKLNLVRDCLGIVIVGAELLRLWRGNFCTWSVFARALGTFRRFRHIPTSPKHGGTVAFPSFFVYWCVYVCVRLHILCAGKQKKKMATTDSAEEIYT